MGGAEIGGGFFTGWKGISVGLAAVGAVAGLVATGIAGSTNNTVILGIASNEFIDSRETDFGAILYSRCRVNGTYNDGDWQETFANVPDGDGGTESTDTIKLSNLDALVQLGDVFAGNDSSPASYRNRPESACFSVCRTQFKASCTEFTYDGLTKDSCRFLSPGKSPPQLRQADTEKEGDNFFVFNATCMQEVRQNILAVIDQPKPGLTRPGEENENTAGGAAGPSEWDLAYNEAMQQAMVFLKTQWAGTLPGNYNQTGGPLWRKAGFVQKAAGCPTDLGGSFATGDHIQSTMATAEQAGVMALARLWWRASFEDDANIPDVESLANLEIGRQSVYLAKSWNATTEQVMIGVGDQLDPVTEELLMFADFGSADFALQVGKNEDNNIGQPVPVAPECTYTTADVNAADVAAHSAAALSLSSLVVDEFLMAGEGVPSKADMIESATALFEYSKEKAPLDVLPGTNATDAAQTLGASRIYPTQDDKNVRSHQLWAACTLFQATDDEDFWDDAETIYNSFIRPELLPGTGEPPEELEPYQLFEPVANFYNPLWWAMLCMAQSAPQYTGLEEEANLQVPRQVAGGAGDDEQYIAFLLNQEFKQASRAEAAQQIWQQFVLPWITFDGNVPAANKRITEAPGDSFRYFDINGPAADDEINPEGGPGVQGLFRDSAGAAVVGLMYADLPGVEADQSHWARCMAVQNINFILGDNADSFSYMSGFGSGNSPVNPFHKDAACPDEDVRASQFQFVFAAGARVVDNPDNEESDELSTRLCDFLTFQGDPTVADQERPADAGGTTFYSVGDSINPVLDNTFNLTGALVSSFLPGNNTKYIDQRMICPDGSSFKNEERTVPGTSEDAIASERCRGDTPVNNPLSQVSVDANGALTAALAGIANLPPSFFTRGCLEPTELAEAALKAFNTARNSAPVQIVDEPQ